MDLELPPGMIKHENTISWMLHKQCIGGLPGKPSCTPGNCYGRWEGLEEGKTVHHSYQGRHFRKSKYCRMWVWRGWKVRDGDYFIYVPSSSTELVVPTAGPSTWLCWRSVWKACKNWRTPSLNRHRMFKVIEEHKKISRKRPFHSSHIHSRYILRISTILFLNISFVSFLLFKKMSNLLKVPQAKYDQLYWWQWHWIRMDRDREARAH